MCQLLALNCAVPTAATFSFTGFAARGGITDHHDDGWGMAFFEDRACRLFVDHRPSAHSPLADLVKRWPIKSTNIVAHLRKATRGPVVLENCHPFLRQLGTRHWIFAHNGDLPDYIPSLTGRYRPVGETDSERAFCALLDGLCERFEEREPDLDELFDQLQALTREIAAHGVFNFMMSNGQVLFTHCSTHLYYVERSWPFSTAQLVDADVSIDFSHHMSPEDAVAVVATSPLTDEAWTRFAPGTLAMFRDGRLTRTADVPVPPHVLEKACLPLEKVGAESRLDAVG
ncbi:MAG TPA: class II glutamine amidotransferase [Paraburkholderia sp.]|jgi:predicted glutamine amidotransferase|nr:class II glutamine amidotransferase [Paraburkholderia sp.]